nr:7910_t:CDS:1 [Entrophospora candida]
MSYYSINEMPFDELLGMTKQSINTVENQSMIMLHNIKNNSNSSEAACTSKNVYLSPTTNWLLPIKGYQKPCLTCQYFGHVQMACPNILQSYRAACNKCWLPGHEFGTCKFVEREIPFRDGYIKPEVLIRKHIMINEGNRRFFTQMIKNII